MKPAMDPEDLAILDAAAEMERTRIAYEVAAARYYSLIDGSSSAPTKAKRKQPNPHSLNS